LVQCFDAVEVDPDGGAVARVVGHLGELERGVGPDDLAVEQRAGPAGRPAEVQREAEKLDVELDRLGLREDPQDRDRAGGGPAGVGDVGALDVHGRDDAAELGVFDLGGEDVPVVEAELLGDDLQRLTVGQLRHLGSQRLGHRFGVTERTHA
jgi:hypothetical protein